MLPYLRDHHADPGRLHAEGHATRVAVETAREQVAALFGARPREVVFTATGTEAVEHRGLGRARTRGGRRRARGDHRGRALVGARRVRRARATDVTTVGVDRLGRFDADEVARRDPTRHRARVGAARQPRGRHAAAGVADDRGRCAASGGVARPRRRVRGRRPRRRRLRRARRRPLLGHRPHVRRPQGRGRAARAARAALPAVRRGRRAGARAARRHRGRARDRRLRRRRGRARGPATTRGARRHGRSPTGWHGGASRRVAGVERFGDPDAVPPPPRVPRDRRRRSRADPARARPARRRRALGLVVLERDARAVAGAHGHGRRRRPLAARQRRVVARPTPTSTRSLDAFPDRRATRGGCAPHDPSDETSTTPSSTCATPRSRATSTRRRSASRSSSRWAAAAVFLRPGTATNHHDLGLFSVGPDAAPLARTARRALPPRVGGPDDRGPRRGTHAPRRAGRARRSRAITA